MKYNNMKYVSDFADKLQRYWKYLCRKHNVDVPLMICNSTQYSEYTLKSMVVPSINSIDQVIGLLNNYNTSSDYKTMAKTFLLFETELGDDFIEITSMSMIVGIKDSDLFLLILENIMQLGALYNEFKIILKHEMGHVLDHYDTFQLSSDDQLAKLESQSDDEDEKINILSKDTTMTRDEFLKYYHSFAVEKRANDKVGLTWKNFRNAERILGNEYNFEINYVKE